MLCSDTANEVTINFKNLLLLAAIEMEQKLLVDFTSELTLHQKAVR